ncbi:hypothetical protein H109_00512 [Trichophyton interdigitale MR816]|uniref:VWFA domain-containing protein n=1 Tax=Trichophyton interdigitale (strain MR816) TaxID=1215338 RepID=A0A059JJA6_TRIIM|nr:hypothetical protein H101_04864 [Trichophyton interdigitale H6]KDB27718.1 hypothetical protein H109_00512 [Trichophyton interdigitale MR816]
MTAPPGIIFEDLEPPNPYLRTPWIPLPSETEQSPVRRSAYLAPRYRTPSDISRRNYPPPPYPENETYPQEKQALLPSSSTSVVVHVIQDIARATITQLFNNNSQIAIRDGKYQFPVPYGSSVVDFKCKIGDREIQGHVKPRDIAQAEFDHARRTGRTTGLVKQDTPEIFTTKLGNIPKETIVEVELSLNFFLKYNLPQRSSITTLTIPSCIAPRYGQPDCEVHQNGPSPGTLSISVEILNADAIDRLDCHTHGIAVERDKKEQVFQSWADFIADGPSAPSPSIANVRLLTGYTCLDRDFVLYISTTSSADLCTPRASLEVHPSIEGHSATMIDIPAEFMLQDQAPVDDKEIIFLVDQSGSMSSKLPGLISAMQIYLRSLPFSIPFNICSFGSSFQYLWKESMKYSDITLNEAQYYVSQFSANLGGTDLLPAMERAVMQQQHHFLDVIVLTDGEVWRLEETLRFVRLTHNVSKKAVRFFSLGIGDAVSHELIEGIAKFGGGYAEVIPPANTNGWEDRLVAVLRASLTGHASSLSVEIEGIDIQNEENNTFISPPVVQMSPADVSTLSPFGRNRIFVLAQNGQIKPSSKIHLKISRGGRISNTTIPIMALQEKDSLLHKFAARALLSDLERENSWIQRDHRIQQGAQTAFWTKVEGERLGCQWALVSKWTSFVGVEDIEAGSRDQRSPEVIDIHLFEHVDDDYVDDGWELLCPRVAHPAPVSASETVMDLGRPVRYGCSDFLAAPARTRRRRPIERSQSSASIEIQGSYCSSQMGDGGSGQVRGPEKKSHRCSDTSSRRIERQERARTPEPKHSMVEIHGSGPSHGAPCRRYGRYIETDTDSEISDPVPVVRERSARRGNKVRQHCQEGDNPILRPLGPASDSISEHSALWRERELPDRNSSSPDYPPTTRPPAGFVASIVSYQRADGCFGVLPLGPEILTIVEALIANGIGVNVATTIVIVALLEEKFPDLKDMWLLIVQKAKQFIDIPEIDEDINMLAAKKGVNDIPESVFQDIIRNYT